MEAHPARDARAAQRACWRAPSAGVGRAVGTLPVAAGLALGRTLGRGAHALLGTPRRLAQRARRASPSRSSTRRRARALVRATFEHAGQSFAELGLWREAAPGIPTTCEIENLAALDDALAGGRGAIAITGHVGNWELLAATVSRARLRARRWWRGA